MSKPIQRGGAIISPATSSKPMPAAAAIGLDEYGSFSPVIGYKRSQGLVISNSLETNVSFSGVVGTSKNLAEAVNTTFRAGRSSSKIKSRTENLREKQIKIMKI